MTNLDALLVDKLGIARALLSRAAMMAAEPEVLGPAHGVLAAQDAIELLLRAIAEERRAKIGPHATFEDLIREIDRSATSERTVTVPHQSRLIQLNKARVNFKHHGVIPDARQARDFVRFAQQAADDICMACTGISLWELTAIRLVRKARIRNYLSAAAHHKTQANYDESCTNSGIAFALIYGEVRASRHERLQDVGRNVRGYANRRSTELSRLNDELGDFAGKVQRDVSDIVGHLERIQRQLDLLKRGIDLDALLRFESLLPTIDVWHSGISVSPSYRSRGRSEDDAAFCLEFAIDAILKGQGEIPEIARTVTQYAEVLEETPLLATFPGPRGERDVEQVIIATKGDRYPVMRTENLGGAVIEVFFEGDSCFIRADRVQLVPAA